MAALHTPPLDRSFTAPDFRLRNIDERMLTLDDIKGEHGTLIMFICNHCPYVQAVADRIARDAKTLIDAGIGVAAIMSNDVEQYPQDSFENMQRFAKEHGFTFPYLIDTTQDVAAEYGAVCTPDFFGFDAGLTLAYRGRLDASKREAAPPDAKRELVDAMLQIATTGLPPEIQHPGMGCSIKWKQEKMHE